MKGYDITFVGHMCFDEIVHYGGEIKIAPGSAVLCGAMAAARIGKKVAVITKMAKKDEGILDSMKEAGIDVYLIPASVTSYMKVVHPTEDVDVRQMFYQQNAGFFKIEEMPQIETQCMHLAGISDQEFNMEFMVGLKYKGYNLSADMQSFVRQVDPNTREVFFKDAPNKKEILQLMNKVKLDIVEGKMLTGTEDIEAAARIFEEWGCPETVITKAEGALARVSGTTFYEKFSNNSTIGRTGRGDTTFAAYLSWRMGHSVTESLKFAAALVSIKMEKQGPFSGTLEDVFNRVAQKH